MTTNITILVQRLKVAAKNGCCHTLFPDDCLALVDALEKSQQRIAELEQKHCGEALMEREIAHSEVINKLMYEIDNRDSRIAELDSRTVKLPKLKMLEDYLAEVAIEERKQILVGVKLEFHRALTAAGIKVEAE